MPRPLYGYEFDAAGRVVVVEEEAAVVRAVLSAMSKADRARGVQLAIVRESQRLGITDGSSTLRTRRRRIARHRALYLAGQPYVGARPDPRLRIAPP